MSTKQTHEIRLPSSLASASKFLLSVVTKELRKDIMEYLISNQSHCFLNRLFRLKIVPRTEKSVPGTIFCTFP